MRAAAAGQGRGLSNATPQGRVAVSLGWTYGHRRGRSRRSPDPVRPAGVLRLAVDRLKPTDRAEERRDLPRKIKHLTLVFCRPAGQCAHQTRPNGWEEA